VENWATVTFDQLVDFYEIQQGGHAIEGNLDTLFPNPLSSTNPEW
jgi:hypothetical protein